MSVKKENCKDCYEATCKRHATEPADTDKSERLKAAFKRLNTAHDKVKMTNGYVGFNEYCQARKEVLDILGKKPKKEEPHIHGPFNARDPYSKCPKCQKTADQLEREAFFAPKESDPELLLTVGQMKELFDNLVMEGFTEEEALSIVAQVSRK